jgi:hypothetical protein
MSDLPKPGTFRLDGMMQGPLPADAAADLTAWAASAKSNGLLLHLRIEGGSYSLVADPAVRATTSVKGGDLETLITRNLQHLLDLLPPEYRTRAFSTLRSEEFRPDTAVQTLYTIAHDGTVRAEQREVEIETGTAPPEVTAASLRRIALPGLVALLLVLFISTFFIDYRSLFGEARDRIVPLKAEEIVVRQEIQNTLVTFELTELDRAKNTLRFRLTRGPGWADAMALTPAQATAGNWPTFTSLLALHQGRCRITLANKKGEPLVVREIDIHGLQDKPSIEVTLVANPRDRIATATLRP